MILIAGPSFTVNGPPGTSTGFADSPYVRGIGAVLINCDEENYNTPKQMEQCHS